jgi:HTH-type transcriptional regulator/antitoxin HigA
MSSTSHDPARIPAESFLPGEYIADELEARGWTQTDLAEILGRPPRLVNELIKGKRGITPETARGLAQAFGTSAELWMNLESAYQLSRVSSPDDAVQRRSRLYDKAPIKEMVRRGWLASSSSIDAMEQQVISFYGLKSLDDKPQIAVAARAKMAGDCWTPSQIAWFHRVRQVAKAVYAAPYAPKKLEDAVQRLRTMLLSPEGIRHATPALAEAGIRLVVVEDLPGTKIDGACLWLDKSSPVVALSLRYDRIDSVWFTLMHELGHVSKGPADASLDVELIGGRAVEGSRPENEQEADRYACEHLVPQARLDDWILRTEPLYARIKIEAFAATVKVHPGIVLGQLKHRHIIDWPVLVGLHAKVRSFILPATLSDGYGHMVPVPLS